MEETEDNWEVVLSHSAMKTFQAVSVDMRERLGKCFDALETDPLNNSNIKRLTGQLKGRYRYRVGDWRVIFSLDEPNRTVSVIAILPRGDAYR